jgi:histidine ammonia-lyase
VNLVVDNQLVGLAELRRIWQRPLTVELGRDAQRRVAESNELVGEVVASGEEIYGVNTGFGQLANVHIGDD